MLYHQAFHYLNLILENWGFAKTEGQDILASENQVHQDRKNDGADTECIKSPLDKIQGYA